MKFKFLLASIILSSFFTNVFASDLIPSTNNIADSLTEEAHAVIREYDTKLELSNANTAKETIKKIITILDKNGDDAGALVIKYDKNSKVKIKQILIYNKNGKRVKKVKKSDIMDIPLYSDANMYTDDRAKIYEPVYPDYPYTVEYEYEVNYSNLLSYENWSPIRDYNISAEHTELTFVYPTGTLFRKKELHIHQFSSHTDKDIVTDSWKCNNIKAIEDEPFDISLSKRLPKVYLMPVDLTYDKHTGSAKNWKEFGSWIYQLYTGKEELNEQEKLAIDTMVKDIPDTIQKIKRLYKYMQNRTRYVNISLGIGGFQPLSAKTVYESGYGDCKALSNYMCSLLKYIGIKSYPALVSSGRYIDSIYRDFPNFSQFDHVILCVPVKSDTIWLECTSNKIPFGFLGDFTDNREVLLIKKNGGEFAHTSEYTANDNKKICKAVFEIDNSGSANGTIKNTYNGLEYDDMSGFLYENRDEQRKWLYKSTSLPSFHLKNFSIKDIRSRIPSMHIDESLRSDNYCSSSGGYLLLPLNKIDTESPVQNMTKKRLSDILIQRSYIETDTFTYKIPDHYRIESIPSAMSIKSNFGSYNSSVSVNRNQITYIRNFSIQQGRFDASEYKKLYEFSMNVSKADNEKAVLVKE